MVAAVALRGCAASFLARAGYAEREKILTVRGPYRHNRTPSYLAQLTMDLGLFLLVAETGIVGTTIDHMPANSVLA